MVKKAQMQCVYCREIKVYPCEFSKEHVISQLLGIFGADTMTLLDSVCANCNDFFSKHLEIYLGRDSVFGILYRSLAGIIRPDAFEKSIKHKRSRIEPSIRHSDHGALLVDIMLNTNKNFDVVIANQILMHNSTKGVRLHFRPSQLPYRRNLEDVGLRPVSRYMSFFSQADNISRYVKEFNYALDKSEIKFQVSDQQFQQFRLQNNVEPLIFKSVIDDNIQRALAKIVFNYFVHQYPRALVYSDSFSQITRFIRYGHKAERYLMIMDYKPIISDIREIHGDEYSKHKIYISQDPISNHIIGDMLLFNKIYIRVILSRDYPIIGIPALGSVFDINEKKVIGINRCIAA